MKRSIRILSLILSAIMLACALASCGAGAPAPNMGAHGYNGMEGGLKGEASDNEMMSPDEVAPGDEDYAEIIENEFINVLENPLTTFSADVDTASYSNIRRMINAGYKLSEIPKNAVRTEEMLN